MKSSGHTWLVRSISANLLLLFSAYSAHAVEIAAGVGVGTLGPGISMTIGLSDRINARLGYGQYSTTDNITKDGVSYDVKLDVQGTSLLLDWHAFGSDFRLTGGIVLNGIEVTGDAAPTGNVVIGSNTYTPAEVGALSAEIGFDDVAGYLGVGWGNAVAGEKGMTFAADLGVMFTGSPSVNLTQVGSTILQLDLDIEEKNLENDIDEFEYYPILRIGMAYKF